MAPNHSEELIKIWLGTKTQWRHQEFYSFCSKLLLVSENGCDGPWLGSDETLDYGAKVLLVDDHDLFICLFICLFIFNFTDWTPSKVHSSTLGKVFIIDIFLVGESGNANNCLRRFINVFNCNVPKHTNILVHIWLLILCY